MIQLAGGAKDTDSPLAEMRARDFQKPVETVAKATVPNPKVTSLEAQIIAAAQEIQEMPRPVIKAEMEKEEIKEVETEKANKAAFFQLSWT